MNKLRTGHLAYSAISALFLSAVAAGCSSEGSSFGTGGSSGDPSTGSTSNGTAGSSNGTAGSSTPGGGSSNGTAGSSNGTAGSSTPGGGTSPGGGTNPGGGSNPGGGDSATGGGGGTTPAEPCNNGNENGICHEFYANDNARNVLNYVNEFDPTKNWTKPVNDTTVNSGRQIELVDNAAVTNAGALNGKAIMISVNKGYQEYHPVTGERIVNVVLAGTTGVRGAVRLPTGNTVLGVGDNKLRVVDKNGATVGQECTLPGAGADSLRVLTLDDATGNILLGRLLDLFIVNVTCQQQWTAKLPTADAKAYSVFPRVGGGVWATSGRPSTVVEINQAGQAVGQVGGKDVHPGIGLDFFSGFERLKNGNIVAANWQGHNDAPVDATPHLVEFTPDNKLVWKWGNQTVARQITNTLILR